MRSSFSKWFLLALAVAAPAFAQSIVQREVNQQTRIANGVQSGELNPTETARLERQQARLQRTVARDRADGRGLTAVERAKIDARQNHLSREIARTRHNGR